MADIKQFRLPDVGEGLTEADIVRWHVKPGDQVAVNQTIVEIETAKSLVELPSPYAGVVTDLLAAEGVTVDVGAPIIAVDVGGGAAPPAPPDSAPVSEQGEAPPAGAKPTAESTPESAAGPAAEPRQAVLVGYGVKLGGTTRRPRKRAAGNGAGAPPARPAAPAAPRPAQALAKPPVRKYARDLGIDLSALTGTGPRGSITRDDVESAAAGGPGPLVLPRGREAGTAGRPREERVPIRGVRKHTAAAVAASAFTAPHVTEFLQIDITATMEATARLRDMPSYAGLRVSPLLFVARALLVAAGRHPMINSTWDEESGEIVVKHYVNLGIAAATERGLVVPNVKDAHLLSMPQLARALAELAETARAGRATPADLSGGTISITNVGVFGVDSGTPILSPGEAAILAFGQVRDGPWVVGGELAVRKVCTLALSFDHRIVDGDLGSAVLREVGAMLTDPLRLLAWS